MKATASWVIEQSEAQFQQAVEQYATLRGWHWLHIQRAMNERSGWRTPVTGRLGKGFPDLMLVRGGRMLFVELKAEKGKMSPAQIGIMSLLGECGNETYTWRPSDWPAILETLA